MPSASPRAWWPEAARSPRSCTAAACSTTRASRKTSPRPPDSRSSTSACTLRGAPSSNGCVSRARLVATADAQRRQLERDLHDGAQQRLLTLSIAVRLARRQLGGGDPALERELAAAEGELGVALAELRELAHGLFPMVLTNEGLGAALEVLAERTPRLVTGALPDGRFAAPVESAAYFVVSEALRRGPSGDVAIDARREGDQLVVEVRAEAEFAGELTPLEDRVGALGGALIADVHHLRAELPCGS